MKSRRLRRAALAAVTGIGRGRGRRCGAPPRILDEFRHPRALPTRPPLHDALDSERFVQFPPVRLVETATLPSRQRLDARHPRPYSKPHPRRTAVCIRAPRPPHSLTALSELSARAAERLRLRTLFLDAETRGQARNHRRQLAPTKGEQSAWSRATGVAPRRDVRRSASGPALWAVAGRRDSAMRPWSSCIPRDRRGAWSAPSR